MLMVAHATPDTQSKNDVRVLYAEHVVGRLSFREVALWQRGPLFCLQSDTDVGEALRGKLRVQPQTADV